MKVRFIVLFIFFQFFGYSQDESNQSSYWGNDKKEAVIAVKNCYVRSEPNSASKLLDSLQLGKKISIKNNSENLLKIKNINTNWAEIEYTNSQDEISKGFIWKGFLALDFIQISNGIFLTRIDKISKKKTDPKENYEDLVFQISIVFLNEKNEELAVKSFQKSLLESKYFENKKIGALGLDNLKEIYRISFSGEACGIPTYYFYFGWNGSELINLPEKMQVSDAGVFYHSEKFIFPKEKGGKPNFIFKEVEEAEIVDENDNIYDVTTFMESYKWNENKATFLNKTKSKKVRKKFD
jgi:hypothetical protein